MAVAAAEHRKEVQALIELGKKKGHLTVDDINALLPPDVSTPDQIDDFMVSLEQADIQVLLDAGQAKKGKKGKNQKQAKKEAKPAEPAKDKDKDDDEKEEAQQEDYGKSNDPV